MDKITFEAELLTLEKFPGSGYIVMPFDVKQKFGKSRVKIKASFDGVPYQGSISPMGGEHILIVVKAIREKINKSHGETIKVEIEEDKEPRTIQLPHDLQMELEKFPALLDFYNSLSYSHQKEYVNWILEAKKTETRNNRIIKMLEMLQKGIKTR